MDPSATSPETTSSWAMIAAFFWEIVKAFIIAMVIIVPIRYFLAQPFFVRGASMEPNFEDGEYLVVDQLSYRFRAPERGEVIVFRYPNRPSQFFIKRIVGLPNERVAVANGQVTVYNSTHPQGVILDESAYLPDGLRTGGQVDMQLGPRDYFVLGDNRPVSSDSRSWGLLPDSDIIGRVWLRAWPADRIGLFNFPRPGFISP
jgi:signal peptidase I